MKIFNIEILSASSVQQLRDRIHSLESDRTALNGRCKELHAQCAITLANYENQVKINHQLREDMAKRDSYNRNLQHQLNHLKKKQHGTNQNTSAR